MSDQMTTAQRNGTRPLRSPVRASLRDIRECAFRALSAAGASHGEAWTAARMVLDAELQDGHGIEVLLADLDRGRWPRAAVTLVETGGAERVTIRLGTPQSNRLLRVGPLAVSLAVAEPGLAGVFVPGELHGLAALDEVLLEVAREQQHAVGVVRWGPTGDGACRVALGEGSLGSGAVRDVGRGSIEGDDDGLWVIAPTPQDLLDTDALIWVSAQERIERRVAAARAGCLVEATAWERLDAASRHYLVG